jgi:hypothetical protein
MLSSCTAGARYLINQRVGGTVCMSSWASTLVSISWRGPEVRDCMQSSRRNTAPTERKSHPLTRYLICATSCGQEPVPDVSLHSRLELAVVAVDELCVGRDGSDAWRVGAHTQTCVHARVRPHRQQGEWAVSAHMGGCTDVWRRVGW